MTVYLGNKPVGVTKIVKKEVAKKALGISIDDIVEVKDGVISNLLVPAILDFSGIEQIASNTFMYFLNHKRGWLKNVSDVKFIGSFAFSHFLDSSGVNMTDLGVASFDSLVEITESGVFSAFAYQTTSPNSIPKTMRFPALKKIHATQAFMQFLYTGFYDPTPTVMDELFPVLEEFSGQQVFQNFYIWEPEVPITFSNVKKITGKSSKYSSCFGSITNNGTVWNFPSATELSGYVWNVTASYTGEIHFAAANQAAIEACDKYAEKWGFAGATIFFDLMLNITVNGVVYSRNRIIDGYTSWEDGSGNLVYTDMTTEPAVGTIVYSDAGTTQVGTVEGVA